MIKIIFRTADADIEVLATVGETLLEVAQKNNIKLFGGCDGAGVCGTCHVHIDSEFWAIMNNFAEPSEDELDMLDVVQQSCETSRLACQVVVRAEFDGMVVSLPKR